MALSHRRDHRRGRRPRPARRPQRRVPDHDRLRRRDALPAARHAEAALGRQAHPLDLPHAAGAGDRPAGQLVGGQRRLRARREPLRRQHRRRRLLAHARGRAALGHPARELGLDHARVRRRGQQLLGLGRLLRLLARPGRQPALADLHARLSDLLAGARLRRHRLHRLLRPLAARARSGHRRRALGLPDRRPHLQLAGARLRRRRATRRRSTSARPTARSTRSRPTAPSCGATTPAIRCAPRRCSAGRRRATARSSTSAPPTACSTRSTPRPASAAGRSTPRPGKAGLADRNDLNGSPALGKRGVYIGGEHGRVWFVPYDFCRKSRRQALHHRPVAGVQAHASPGRSRSRPAGTTLRGSTENVPAATTLAARLVVRRDGETIDAAIDPALPQRHLQARRSPSRASSPATGTSSSSAPTRSSSRRPTTGCRCPAPGPPTAPTAPSSKTLHLRHRAAAPASTRPRRSRAARCRRSSSPASRCRSRRCCRA